jgi:hypothetical protein
MLKAIRKKQKALHECAIFSQAAPRLRLYPSARVEGSHFLADKGLTSRPAIGVRNYHQGAMASQQLEVGLTAQASSCYT